MPRMQRQDWIDAVNDLTKKMQATVAPYAKASRALTKAKSRFVEARLTAIREAKAYRDSLKHLNVARDWPGQPGGVEGGEVGSEGDAGPLAPVDRTEESLDRRRKAATDRRAAAEKAEKNRVAAYQELRQAELRLRHTGQQVDIAYGEALKWCTSITKGIGGDSPAAFRQFDSAESGFKGIPQLAAEIGEDHRRFFEVVRQNLNGAIGALIEHITHIDRERAGKSVPIPECFPDRPAHRAVEIHPPNEPVLPGPEHGLDVPFSKTQRSLPDTIEPPYVPSDMRPIGSSRFGRPMESCSGPPSRSTGPLGDNDPLDWRS